RSPLLARLRVPELDGRRLSRPVIAVYARGDGRPVGAEDQTHHKPGVPAESGPLLPFFPVPQLHRPVGASQGKYFAVGAGSYGRHIRLVSAKCGERLARIRVPEDYLPAPASGGNRFAVGAEGYEGHVQVPRPPEGGGALEDSNLPVRSHVLVSERVAST